MKAEEILATLSAPDREGLASNVRNWMRALGIMEARAPMIQPQCVITGCALFDGDAWVAADLFDAGDFWLVNANVRVIDGVIGIEWYKESVVPTIYSKWITILDGCPFWERRGAFLIHKSCAVLNRAAIDYMK